MGTRKEFIAVAAGAGALIAALPADAQTSATPKISDAARALAERMRQFDPKLSDAELHTIAEGIDQQFTIGRSVNPKGKALKNSDEPATIFEVTKE